MNIATYNIASGGFDGYDSVAQTPERLDKIIGAVHTVDADVIGLTDTFRWDSVLSSQDIQEAFGYPYSYHIAMDDSRVDKRIGVAVLSRLPIVTHESIRAHNRNAIKVTLRASTLLDVYVVYLDDLKEATRTAEMQALLETTDHERPTAIIGDYNALWPAHVPTVRQAVQTFTQSHPQFTQRDDYPTMQAAFADMYRGEALITLAAAGFSEASFALPTAMTSLHPFNMPEPLFPIDHILTRQCSGHDYAVYKGRDFEAASDHLPLRATIDL